MAKTIKLEDRIKIPVITQVTFRVREQMERMARHDKVSLAEIGRRALTQYVEQKEA